MSIYQLMHNHIDAVGKENAAFRAIECGGTDEQWNAYFDASFDVGCCLALLLDAACEFALSNIEDESNKARVESFFDTAKRREGETRDKAIKKAYEFAMIEGDK